MRLFIAVNFSEEIKTRLLELQKQLRSQALRGSFTRTENFHLTLAFLGETPEEKLPSLYRIMEEVQSPPFDISFNRTGCFTHRQKELWWVSIDKDCPGLPLLQGIHRQLTGSLEKQGFPVDKRPFNPHITIGREIKRQQPIVLECQPIKVKVNHISLVKSEHSVGVRVYSELNTVFFPTTGT